MVLSPALQALLWAALVFPGAGHVHLKYYRRGVALIVVTLSSLALLLAPIVRHAGDTVQQSMAGDATFDLPRMVDTTLQACAADPMLKTALWALLLCWLVGMIDAYRLGRLGPQQRRKPPTKAANF